MQYMPTHAQQVVYFMYSAGLGFALGLVYDLFRMLFYLLTGSDKKRLVFRDIIYLLVFFSATFLFLLSVCDGQLILYVFIAQALGVYMYFYSLSGILYPPVIRFACRIKRLFRLISARLTGFRTQFSVISEKILKNLHKITKKDLHIRHNIVYNFFVKLCSGSFILKNRGDEGGKGEERKA